MAGQEARVPVGAVVGERQPNPGLRGVGFFSFSAGLAVALAFPLPRRLEQIQQPGDEALSGRRRADSPIVGEVDRPVIVVGRHHVRRVDARNPYHPLVLPLAKRVANELIVAAGDDVDVLTDLALRIEDDMHRAPEGHGNEKCQKRRFFHDGLRNKRAAINAPGGTVATTGNAQMYEGME